MNAIVTAVENKGAWFHGQSDRELLDAFLVAQKPAMLGTRFNALGDMWRSITKSEAVNLVTSLSTRSLAYRAPFDLTWVGEIAPADVVALFRDNARWYTNVYSQDMSEPAGWFGATQSTFDIGVGVVDQHHVAICWAQDED